MADKRGDVDEAAFADLVQEIVSGLRKGVKGAEWAGAGDDQRRVAACLSFLSHAVYATKTPDTEEWRSLKRDAHSLIEAITDGDDDPVWLHIRGLQKAHKGRPPLTYAERYRRVTVLGYVNVLKGSSNKPWLDAEESLRDNGIRITTSTMKGWEYRADEVMRAEAKQWAADIKAIAGQRGDDPKAVSLKFAVENWRSKLEYPGVSELSDTPGK